MTCAVTIMSGIGWSLYSDCIETNHVPAISLCLVLVYLVPHATTAAPRLWAAFFLGHLKSALSSFWAVVVVAEIEAERNVSCQAPIGRKTPPHPGERQPLYPAFHTVSSSSTASTTCRHTLGLRGLIVTNFMVQQHDRHSQIILTRREQQ